MGAAAREPPALALAWAVRIGELGRQADAVLKMLTILHRLQLHSPAFAATLLSSTVDRQPFVARLAELATRFASVSAAARGPFIRAYLAYLQLRIEAPPWIHDLAAGGGEEGGGGGGGEADAIAGSGSSVGGPLSRQRRMA